MEAQVENIISYILIFGIIVAIIFLYLRKKNKSYKTVSNKIEKAIQLGFHEPVTLHPVIDPEKCIGSGACVAACPENDILGIVGGHAKTINASRCVGHGACFHACPVEAITLVIGTEKRGVDLPHLSPEFETNIPGLFIAGELGGMGLIKNAMAQGKQAVEFIIKKLDNTLQVKYDLIIVGAGPAGISAVLTAAKYNLKYLTIEQESLGGTVFNFPRAKIVMTSPMDLPLHGKVHLAETSKLELLELWGEVLGKNGISINEQEKVISIEKVERQFVVKTSKETYRSKAVLLSIGRRGSPRKLNVPGEHKQKVYYKLLEPELIHNLNILVVGGGDSAIESALLLADEKNYVTISYRNDSFSRLKPKNLERISEAIHSKKINIIFNSNVKEIDDNEVVLKLNNSNSEKILKNDLVYIFAGGELPSQFLEKIGIKITKKFGEAILKH